MATHVVLVPVTKNSNGRKYCEAIQGDTYYGVEMLRQDFEHNQVVGASILSLNEYMDFFNNADGDIEELNPNEYWMSYVSIKEVQ